MCRSSPCIPCVQNKVSHQCWKCYHFKVVDAEQIKHFYVEQEILLDWLNLTPKEEATPKDSKMYLHNATHADNGHRDINCISYCPSTNDERAQFSSAITDELLLRDMDPGESGLDEMRSMLKEVITMEIDLAALRERIEHCSADKKSVRRDRLNDAVHFSFGDSCWYQDAGDLSCRGIEKLHDQSGTSEVYV
jgi:hypothetical protein